MAADWRYSTRSIFRTKICGITEPGDAKLAAAAGAEAIGLNFFPGSSRYVTIDHAAAIVDAVPPEVAKVGVFVNASHEDIQGAVERLGLDFVQLHGDETPRFCSELAAIPTVRAFRLRHDRHDDVTRYVTQCENLGLRLAAVLVDAYQQGEYGGTGKVLDWSHVPALSDTLHGIPLILAGGLTAENVREAIFAATPSSVDTASGVESSPGQKDPAKVAAFIQSARAAFAQIAR